MSITKSVLAAGDGRVVLIYANQEQDSVIFATELRGLVARHPDRFAVVHWLESVQSPLSVPVLRELVRPLADRECFVCGPGDFTDPAAEALIAFDPEREGWRTFRVDRLDQPRATGRRFDPRPLPAEGLAEYLRH
ncbi:hypothetical protein ACWDKQ_10255 [Saccharopolyspora sp. NPDC000995]